MSRTFENQANNHRETVDFGSSVAVLFFGLIYRAYRGLWSHVLIWFVVVVGPTLLGAGFLTVLAFPLVSLFYVLTIQSFLSDRYLSRGWREVKKGAPERSDDLAIATARILAGPDPMLPRGPAAATKLCPFCAEEVKAAAIRCKHCQADLPADLSPVPNLTVSDIQSRVESAPP
jgi:hypothetical protein